MERLRKLTEEEARAAVRAAVEVLVPRKVRVEGEEVQVVFAEQECRRCGQEGDGRLMVDRCHARRGRGHTAPLVRTFSNLQVPCLA